ncbi:hypothetical protein VDR70_015810 [Xanthomonas campestris pv. campestris]|uniref:hypothetical protein n=1 Tax=Xanthomonas campestris TaxID=339 RepID=UPI001E323F8F|nr:hypothetical protein [Xanthomonas campestris]MCC5074255.1 hypothetical protein [Xanthomonas campestris pv. plantaginis]MCF8839717.1 hypothetical protein [Xanthomonas campestris pv. campestris]MDM7676553.1 hypothetical protein [Xanthomonas campestris pv. campestris]MDM7681120.1 hypothetical protein [Xanthomonas campestris pv. campestris]MDM7702106.1 hypothetical protein [Xanthomonas campestris pv. campestris]
MSKDATILLLAVCSLFVSTATFLVALSQMKIASAKTRLDLYSKRFNIYLSALEYYQAIWGLSDKPLDRCTQDFIKSYRESQFLFKDTDGIYATLTEIKDTGSSATHLQNIILETEQKAGSDLLELGDLRKQRTQQLDGFEQSLTGLEKQLSKYIRFEEASGWHPFRR